jgi:hypothetical protein
LRRRFDAIDEAGYRGAHDDADFEHTWDAFVDVQYALAWLLVSRTPVRPVL